MQCIICIDYLIKRSMSETLPVLEMQNAVKNNSFDEINIFLIYNVMGSSRSEVVTLLGAPLHNVF